MSGDVVAPLAEAIVGFQKHYGGTRGLLAWMDYAEREVARDPDYCAWKIQKCEWQNAVARETGKLPLPSGFYVEVSREW